MLLVELEEVLVAAPVEPFEVAPVASVLDVPPLADEEFIVPDVDPVAELFSEFVLLVEVAAPVESVLEVEP